MIFLIWPQYSADLNLEGFSAFISPVVLDKMEAPMEMVVGPPKGGHAQWMKQYSA